MIAPPAGAPPDWDRTARMDALSPLLQLAATCVAILLNVALAALSSCGPDLDVTQRGADRHFQRLLQMSSRLYRATSAL